MRRNDVDDDMVDSVDDETRWNTDRRSVDLEGSSNTVELLGWRPSLNIPRSGNHRETFT